MIPRYARAEITDIWSPETKFRIWFEIEAHAADAMAEIGMIPREAARIIGVIEDPLVLGLEDSVRLGPGCSRRTE